ncbi:hypothetical protein [Kitasatospora griseola]|uniref:hypothetical protein n=1 Tax=Kitasatospora griseola TaxID=2064 RepID=UPI00167060BA|nr:hypothetical protein [Kitasatospora griseola]GGR03451.1 hypothetical protein GCM10010195_68820 [Kitasatospora griseola]
MTADPPLPPAAAGLSQRDFDTLSSLAEQLTAFAEAIPVPAPHEPLPELRELVWPMVRLHELITIPLDETFFLATNTAGSPALGVFTATTTALTLTQAALARAANLLTEAEPTPEAQSNARRSLTTARDTARSMAEELGESVAAAPATSPVTALASRRRPAIHSESRPPAAGDSERRVDAALRRSPALVLISPPAEPPAPPAAPAPSATVVPLRRT